MNTTLGMQFWKELEAEAPASRKCLERFEENLAGYKPHEKSMPMGYLALVVAEIPRWVSSVINDGVIDFGTFSHPTLKTGAELAAYFDKNMEGAKEALGKVSDEALTEMFYLKNNGQTLMSDQKGSTVGSSINHMVHHRGQLTVYMRLNNIAVPSIYGPSADDKSF
jgi:hypothetical protein